MRFLDCALLFKPPVTTIPFTAAAAIQILMKAHYRERKGGGSPSVCKEFKEYFSSFSQGHLKILETESLCSPTKEFQGPCLPEKKLADCHAF